jgi:hydrogenase/urease accessory protein HupE
LRLASDGTPCPGELEGAELGEADGVVLRLRYACARPPLALALDADFVSALASGHRHLAHLALPAAARDSVLSRANPSLQIPLGLGPSEPSALARFASFFRMGVEHILTGYDHLLFLCGLLLLVGPLRGLLGAVTAFTLAHSLTLSAAALGWVVPSPRWIEPLIALSVAYVGIENRFARNANGRWRLTFLFGLVHGFGFAGALREISLPPAQLPLALCSFNLGVEAAQLAVLALLLPTLSLARRLGSLTPARTNWLNAGVSVVGVVWLVQRVAAALG